MKMPTVKVVKILDSEFSRNLSYGFQICDGVTGQPMLGGRMLLEFEVRGELEKMMPDIISNCITQAVVAHQEAVRDALSRSVR